MRWSYIFAASSCTGSIYTSPTLATRTVRYVLYASRVSDQMRQFALVFTR